VSDLLTPILLSGPGRSGTTAIMALLGTDSRVAFDRRYPFENRYLTYLAKFALLSGRPPVPSHLDAFQLFRYDEDRFGPAPWSSGPGDDGTLPLQPTLPEWLTGLWRTFSASVKARHPEATHYAEKVPPWVSAAVRGLVPCRVLHLVRDPRDVFLSARDFAAARGLAAFHPQMSPSDRDQAWHLAQGMLVYAENERADRGQADAMLVRYEDLVQEPAVVVGRLNGFLGLSLDATSEDVTRHLARHRTSTEPVHSIGRWRREALPPAVRACLESLLAGPMADYGYELSPGTEPAVDVVPDAGTGSSDGSATGGAGGAAVTVTDGDVSIDVPPRRLEADTVAELWLCLRGSTGSHCSLSWRGPDEGFAEPRSIRVPFRPGRHWQILRFRLGDHPDWRGTVAQLRLGLFSGAVTPGAAGEVRWLRTVGSWPEPRRSAGHSWWTRISGRVKSRPAARPSFRGHAGRVGRLVYRALPLSPASKKRLKGLVFRLGAPFLRDTVSYRAWVESEDTLDVPRLPMTGTPSATANLYEEAYRVERDRARSEPSSEYVPLDEAGVGPGGPGVKLIAFYLPQFHPISANDAAWGRGFTEWTNVSKAAPQFRGHYQPRLPGELGFYDLRVPEVQRRQVELARLYGLHGFCFHYYWFSGRRVLERPLEQFHADKSLDFGYCVCWANENWTRRWDGRAQDVLLAQAHSPEDDLAFLEAVSPYLKDPRYIRVDGKPLLLVYRPQLLPDPGATATRWREHSRRIGLPGLYLAAAQTFGLRDPTPLGFDAAVEFPPHNMPAIGTVGQLPLLNKEFRGRAYHYGALVEAKVGSYRGQAFPVFRSVCPGWDNEARRPGAGNVFLGSDPATYGRWLASACAASAQNADPDMRLVFVNAWNEWAEGAYLEPDRRYGYAYLAETKRVVKRFVRDGGGARLAVIAHVYYDELWPQVRRYLHNIPEPFDLFATVPPSLGPAVRWQMSRDFPKATVLECENRGRDILPFLKMLDAIGLSRYRLVCKIHSKRSAHRRDGALWRKQILQGLLGSPAAIDRIVGMFEEHPGLAMAGAPGMILQSTYYWGVRHDARSNRAHVGALAARLGVGAGTDHFYFVAGSMFWVRPEALKGLLDLGLSDADFEAETGQHDGTMAHAMERFLGLLVRRNGFWLADTAGTRFDRISTTGRPYDPRSVRCAFARPTFDGEYL
jgi:lipopolysaccharide biosynthesis protein